MANSGGGCFLPNENQTITGGLTFASGATLTGATLSTSTLTSPTITGPAISGTVSGAGTYTTPTLADPVITTTAGTGSFVDRVIATDVVAISGAALHAANLTLWTAPANAIVLRVLLNVTTVATGACTVDIGYTASTATTSSDTFLDGIDVNGATGLFDSMDATLDTGTNAHAQLAASGKWITADEKTGDATGLVAVAYIQYVLV